MREDVRSDYEWQLKFLPEIRRIVGPMLLVQSTLEMDMTEATDMLVLHARDMRIGCRVRRAAGEYAERYPWEFTLRSRRNSGAQTELDKITEGWGDWLFYGHAMRDDQYLMSRWFVIDLDSYRTHLIRRNKFKLRTGEKPNGDNSTWFRWFDLRSFPPKPPILVASSHDLPRAVAA